MTAHIKKILIGTSIAVSLSAFSTNAAFATSLTRASNIKFITNNVANTAANKPNINTWTYAPGAPVYDNTGIGGVNRRVLNDYNNYGDVNKAIAALTDNDSTTNVELFTSSGIVKDHVGFTANLGNNNIKIESVTKADWADGKLATAWLTGFRDTYSGLLSSANLLNLFNANFNSLASYLTTNGFNTAGDPNIGDLTYNQQTGDLKIDLVGHLNLVPNLVDTRQKITVNGQIVNNPNYLGYSPNFTANSTGNQIFDLMLYNLAKVAFLQNKPLQISEIAKVTFNNQVSYAYSFKSVESGAIAGDRDKTTDTTSHTGIYSWTKNVKSAAVPEPSALLGLMTIGGLALARRKVRKNMSFE